MAERAPLEVTAVVVEGRGARDPVADLHAQLEEAKAAAMAAADRMQSLLQQMAVMEAAAAERRLAELNVRAELNRQQLACADQQAATSSTSRSVLVEPPQPAGANALTAEPRPDAKEAGVHQDERHHGITMTDIFDDPDHKDEQAPIDTKLPFLLHDTSKADSPAPSAALSGSAPRSSKVEAGRAPQRAQLGTLMGVFVPCLQNILGTIYFLRLSWIVALQGINNTLLAVGIACATTFCTSLSLSAIATNGAIRSGGPYYLISRALGPEFGGSVGLCFYLGTTVAGAMYMLGTSEPLLLSFPQLEICGLDDGEGLPTTNIIIWGYIILAFASVLIFSGVKYVTRFSPFFLVAVLLSIVLIWVGLLSGGREIAAEIMSSSCGQASNASEVALLALGTKQGERVVLHAIHGPSADTISSNYWPPSPLIEEQECTDAGYQCDFTFALALFFPSVTGIMAGSNRSGDLKDAQRSIPLGTVCATLATSLLYLLSALVFGAVTDRAILSAKNEVLFTAVVSWPSEYVVRVGIVLSSFGAGLQSLTGAPRLLQAIANDDLIPILRPFQGTGEPRRPLALTILICAACIASGNVNSVAPIITMFFLLCYAFVNLACLLQDLLKEPNWRPRFRFYHPATSFCGLVLCLFIMFFTRWYFALASIVVVMALYLYIQLRKVEAQWGDGLKGMRYQQARKALQELEKLDGQEHIKNWRPQVLLLVKPGVQSQTVAHPKLLGLLRQLKGARGLCILGSVVPGRLAQQAKLQGLMERALRRQRDEHKLAGFTQVIMTPNVGEGLTALIQTAGLGGLYPNTVMLGWSQEWREHPYRAEQMCRLLLTAAAYNQALIVIKGMEHIPDVTSHMTRPMDIWWMVHDGGLQLLLTTILRKGRVWSACALRVFCVLQFGEDPQELQTKVVGFLYQMRIDAEVKCVVLSEGAALVDKAKEKVAWQLSSAIVSAPIGGLLEPTPSGWNPEHEEREHEAAHLTGASSPGWSTPPQRSTSARRPSSPKASPALRPSIPRSGLSSSAGALPRFPRSTSTPGILSRAATAAAESRLSARVARAVPTPTSSRPATSSSRPACSQGRSPPARSPMISPLMRSASHGSPMRSPSISRDLPRSPLMRSHSRLALRRISSRSPAELSSAAAPSPRSTPSASADSSPGLLPPLRPPPLPGGGGGGCNQADVAPAPPFPTTDVPPPTTDVPPPTTDVPPPPTTDGARGQRAPASDDAPPPAPASPPPPPSDASPPASRPSPPLRFTPLHITPPPELTIPPIAAGGGGSQPSSSASIVYEEALQPPPAETMARPLTPGSKMKTSTSFHSAEQLARDIERPADAEAARAAAFGLPPSSAAAAPGVAPAASGEAASGEAATPLEASTLLATTILNRLICKYSKESALVMTNLPMPGEAQSPANYMKQVDTLVDSLPLCMLIMGQKNSDVVTMYS